MSNEEISHERCPALQRALQVMGAGKTFLLDVVVNP
jgi:hypothetical protein